MEEEEKSFAQRLYGQAEDYVKTTIELYRLKSIKVFTEVFAAAATAFALWVIVFLFLLFASLGAALYLGELLGSLYQGFFIVCGFYALLGVIAYLLRVKCIKDKINNFIIRQIFKD